MKALFEGYRPHRNQWRFHQATESQVVVVSPAGEGKSTAMIYEVIKKAWASPYKGIDGACMITAPTFDMLNLLLIMPMKSVFEGITIAGRPILKDYNESKKIFTLINDRIIIGRSAEQPDKLRGPNIYYWFPDELALHSLEAYEIMQTRLRKVGSGMRGATTPKGTAHWLYDKWFSDKSLGEDEEGIHEKTGVRIIRFQNRDNKYIPEIERKNIESQLSERMALQEVYGKFIAPVDGLVYYTFSHKRNVQEIEFDRNLPIMVGMDFNVGINAWVMAQQRGRNIHVFAEGYGAADIGAAGAQIKAATKALGVSSLPTIYPDKTGITTHSNTDGRTAVSSLIQLGFPVYTQSRSNPSRVERFENVNAMFCNALGEVHLTVSPRCKRTIRELETYSYNPKVRGKTLDAAIIDGREVTVGHITDGLGYMVYDRTEGYVFKDRRAA